MSNSNGKRKLNLSVTKRRHAVSRLYLKGMIQVDIAEQVGVAQQTISDDLKIIQKQWLESAAENYGHRKAAEVAKIDEVERTAWEKFSRSCSNNRDGNPRYLEIVLDCVQKRVNIFGLNAPIEVAASGMPWTEPRPLELEARIEAIKARRLS